jgi:hypothetical protein
MSIKKEMAALKRDLVKATERPKMLEEEKKDCL